jgi:hypothetical protein
MNSHAPTDPSRRRFHVLENFRAWTDRSRRNLARRQPQHPAVSTVIPGIRHLYDSRLRAAIHQRWQGLTAGETGVTPLDRSNGPRGRL